MNRYEVILSVPKPDKGCWHLVSLGRFKTKESAINRAVKVLSKHPTVETYSKRERWTWDCTVRDRKTNTIVVEYVSSPVEIVPSVGELGWTP